MNQQELINNIAYILQGGANPQQIIENMVRQNPNSQAILNQMRQSGMSPKDFVLQFARQNNINISQIVQGLSQRGIKL